MSKRWYRKCLVIMLCVSIFLQNQSLVVLANGSVGDQQIYVQKGLKDTSNKETDDQNAIDTKDTGKDTSGTDAEKEDVSNSESADKDTSGIGTEKEDATGSEIDDRDPVGAETDKEDTTDTDDDGKETSATDPDGKDTAVADSEEGALENPDMKVTLEDNQFMQDMIIYEIISETNHQVKVVGTDRDTIYQKVYGPTAIYPDGLSVTIPSTVSQNDTTYQVVEIGEFAFADYSFRDDYFSTIPLGEVIGDGYGLAIKEVTLSEGIIKIGKGAFFRSYHIHRINLPNSVTEVGAAAFAMLESDVLVDENEDLRYINQLPKELTKIGTMAFANVAWDMKLVIPSKVQYIGKYAFYYELDYGSFECIEIPASVAELEESALENMCLKTVAMYRKDILYYENTIFGQSALSGITLYVAEEMLTVAKYKYSENVSGLKIVNISEYDSPAEEETVIIKKNGEEIKNLVANTGDSIDVTLELSANLTMQDLTVNLKEFTNEDVSFITGTVKDAIKYTLEGQKLIIQPKARCFVTIVISKGDKDLARLRVHAEGAYYTTEGFLKELDSYTDEQIQNCAKVPDSYMAKPEWAYISDFAKEITVGCNSRRDKAYAVNKWLADHVIYDDVAYGSGCEKPLAPYQVLTERYTVCEGYAYTAEALLRSLGVPCVYISGMDCGPHAWNAFYDDEAKKWIHFDATHDANGRLQINYDLTFNERFGYQNFDGLDLHKVTRYYDYVDGETAEFATSKVQLVMDKTVYTILEGESEVWHLPYIAKKVNLKENARVADVTVNGNDITITAHKAGKIEMTVLLEDDATTPVQSVFIRSTIRVMPRRELKFYNVPTKISLQDASVPLFRCKYGDTIVTDYLNYESSDEKVCKVVYENGRQKICPVGTGKVTLSVNIPFDVQKILQKSFEISVVDYSLSNKSGAFTYRCVEEPSEANGMTGTVEITGFDPNEIEEEAMGWTFSVPSTLDYKGYACKVVGIAAEAFACDENQELASVLSDCGKIELPEYLQYIGADAFSHFWTNEAVECEIPASLEKIGEGAFKKCNIAKLVFPENSNLQSIGDNAFAEDFKMQKADLSNCHKLKTIGDGAFRLCASGNPLESADWAQNNRTGLTEVKLPEGLESIGAKCFDNDYNLVNVQFPTSLVSVGDSAFYGCSRISQTITFGNHLKNLGDSAFYGCNAIEKVTFTADEIEDFGNSIFSTSRQNFTVCIPDTEKHVYECAFSTSDLDKLRNQRLQYADGSDAVEVIISFEAVKNEDMNYEPGEACCNIGNSIIGTLHFSNGTTRETSKFFINTEGKLKAGDNSLEVVFEDTLHDKQFKCSLNYISVDKKTYRLSIISKDALAEKVEKDLFNEGDQITKDDFDVVMMVTNEIFESSMVPVTDYELTGDTTLKVGLNVITFRYQYGDEDEVATGKYEIYVYVNKAVRLEVKEKPGAQFFIDEFPDKEQFNVVLYYLNDEKAEKSVEVTDFNIKNYRRLVVGDNLLTFYTSQYQKLADDEEGISADLIVHLSAKTRRLPQNLQNLSMKVCANGLTSLSQIAFPQELVDYATKENLVLKWKYPQTPIGRYLEQDLQAPCELKYADGETAYQDITINICFMTIQGITLRACATNGEELEDDPILDRTKNEEEILLYVQTETTGGSVSEMNLRTEMKVKAQNQLSVSEKSDGVYGIKTTQASVAGETKVEATLYLYNAKNEVIYQQSQSLMITVTDADHSISYVIQDMNGKEQSLEHLKVGEQFVILAKAKGAAKDEVTFKVQDAKILGMEIANEKVIFTVKSLGITQIHMTAKTDAKINAQLVVAIKDFTPVIAEDVITIDKNKKVDALVTIIPRHGASVDANSLSVTFPKKPEYNSLFVLRVENAERNQYRLEWNDFDKNYASVKKGTQEMVISGKWDGQESEAQIGSLSMKITETVPGITIKQTQKVNLFFTKMQGDKISGFSHQGEGKLAISVTNGKLRDITVDNPDFELTEEGMIRLKALESSKTVSELSKKMVLKLRFEGYRDNYVLEKTCNVNISNTKPNLQLVLNDNTLYTAYGMRQTQFHIVDSATKEEIPLSDFVLLEGAGRYFKADSTGVISATGETLKADTIAVKLQQEFWKEPLLLNIKLAVNAGKPQASLNQKAITLNTFSDAIRTDDAVQQAFGVKGCDGITVTDIDVERKTANSQSIAVVYESGMLRTCLKDNTPVGNYVFNIVPKVSIGGQAETLAPCKLTVKVVNKEPKLTVAMTGKPNILNRSVSAVCTPKLTGINGKVKQMELIGADAQLFDYEWNETQQKLAVRCKENAKFEKNTKYMVQYKAVVGTTEVVSPVVSIVIPPVKKSYQASNIKLKYSAQAAFDKNVQQSFIISAKNIGASEPESVTLVDSTGAFTIENGKCNDLGQMPITLTLKKSAIKNRMKVLVGKTYTIKLEVRTKNDFIDEKPTVITLKVKITQ